MNSICLCLCLMAAIVSSEMTNESLVPVEQIGRAAVQTEPVSTPTPLPPPLKPKKVPRQRFEMLLTAIEKKSQRIAEHAVEIEKIAAEQAHSPSASIMLNPERTPSNPAAHGISLIHIGPTEVYINFVKHPIFDGKILFKGELYVVCSKGIAKDEEFVCCGRYLYSKKIGPIECCNDIFVFTDTEVCCGDYFYAKRFQGQDVGCCHGNAYLHGRESCCNRAVIESPVCGGGGITCNAGPDQFCCNGVAVRRFYGRTCCPNVGSYFPGFQSCCGNQIVRGQTCP